MDDDDDSCVMKYIEIVPLDNFNNFSDDVTHIKQEPDTVKVYLSYVFMYQLTPEYWNQYTLYTYTLFSKMCELRHSVL